MYLPRSNLLFTKKKSHRAGAWRRIDHALVDHALVDHAPRKFRHLAAQKNGQISISAAHFTNFPVWSMHIIFMPCSFKVNGTLSVNKVICADSNIFLFNYILRNYFDFLSSYHRFTKKYTLPRLL